MAFFDLKLRSLPLAGTVAGVMLLVACSSGSNGPGLPGTSGLGPSLRHGDIKTIGSGFTYPRGVAVDPAGNVYVADTGNNLVKRVDPSGVITTLGSNLKFPYSVAFQGGNVYVAATFDRVGPIEEIPPKGAMVRIGKGFYIPQGVAVDSKGNVYVADTGNNLAKVVRTNGRITRVGKKLNIPSDVAVDKLGNVYVSNTFDNAVEKVSPKGGTTVVGSGFNHPEGLAVDGAGDVFVADTGNNAVKEVLPDGTIQTIGTGFNAPSGVALDSKGDVFVADTYNNAVKEWSP
jgi:large repetitive protein